MKRFYTIEVQNAVKCIDYNIILSFCGYRKHSKYIVLLNAPNLCGTISMKATQNAGKLILDISNHFKPSYNKSQSI